MTEPATKAVPAIAEPFFDLDNMIAAARSAAIEARKRAAENPSDAARHIQRSDWYLERARQWREELERDDERPASV